MYKFITGVAMGMVIVVLFYVAVSIDSSTVKLPLAIIAVLVVLIAATIYLAYRFHLQDRQINKSNLNG